MKYGVDASGRILISRITNKREAADQLGLSGIVYLDQIANYSDEQLMKHRRVGKLFVWKLREKFKSIYNTQLNNEDVLI